MKTIIKIILLAVVSAALAIVAEQLIAALASAFWQKEIVLESFTRFTWFLALSAVIEEISKYWAIYFVIRNRLGLQKMRFIFASLLLGAAWGIFEVGLVLFADQKVLTAFQSGNPELLFSFGSIIALHALTAYLMGIFVSLAAAPSRLKHFKILLFPILLHILFNFLIIQKGDFTNFLTIMTLAIGSLAGIVILAVNYRKLA